MAGWAIGAGIMIAGAVAATSAVAQEGGRQGGDREQIFIAPSGEPFRVPAGAPYPVASWFAQADLNHDGKIDQGEFVADFVRFFDRIDLDHNGILSPAEVKRYENEVAPEVRRDGGDETSWDSTAQPGRRDRSGGHGGRGGHERHGGHGDAKGGAAPGQGGDEGSSASDESGPPSAAIGQSREIQRDLLGGGGGGGRYELIDIPEPVSAMDSSFSGYISRADALAAAQRRFHLLDPDDKGSLTRGDLPQTLAQRAETRAQGRRH